MSNIKLNIVRTTKDKIFDIVFLVLTLAIWGIREHNANSNHCRSDDWGIACIHNHDV